MRLTTFFACICVCIIQVHAQSSGDFRTKQSGNWNNISAWELFNGTSWVGAASPPTSANNVITISTGHEITISAGNTVLADQLYLQGSLFVESSATLSLVNGAGDDLTFAHLDASLIVEGSFVRSNLTTIINPFGEDSFSFQDGSVYSHKYTASFGDLPAATWSQGSTVLVNGLANASLIIANATWDQEFGNLIFNNPSQKGIVNLAGFIKTVRGNLSVTNTNGFLLQFSDADNLKLTIGDSEFGGDFTISGNSRIHISNAGTDTVNVHGDFIYTSSNTTGSYFASTGTAVVNVYGNFEMATSNSGKLMLGGSGTTGNTTMNLYGDFSLTGGQLYETGSGQTRGTVRFLKTGVAGFANAGTISGYVNYYVAPACALNLGTSTVSGSGSSRITVDGTLMLGSLDPQGAISSGSSNGNIQVPYRTFNDGSTVIYNGAEKQFLSTSHPTSSGVTTVIDNLSGVRLLENVSIAGTLVLENGDLELGGFALTSTGFLQRSTGRFSGGTTSSIYIKGVGSGSWGDIVMNPSSDTLSVLQIDRTSPGAGATIVGPVKVHSLLELKAGTVNNAGDLWMIPGAGIHRYGEAEIFGSAIKIEDGSYHVEYRSNSPASGPYVSAESGIELPNEQSYLASLTISLRQTSDEVRLMKDIWVNGDFTLSKGKFFQNGFDITMQGTNWNDDLGTMIPENGSVVFNSDSTRVNGSADPVFGNITITTGNRAYFVRNFRVDGNIEFQSGSTFDMASHVLILTGSDPQSISANGATFSNINVSKSNGEDITLASPLNLTGVFQFVSPSSNVQLHSNGHLVLKSGSDDAGVGMNATVYRLAGGNSITGDVTVERFMSGEGKIYRYISSPVSNSNVAQLKDAFLVQGNFNDPSPTQNICGVKAQSSTASLFWYDETTPGNINNGYVAYPGPGMSAADSPLIIGRGYAAYIRQCSIPTIINYRGTLNQGTISIPVSYTTSDPTGDGWNLVGNPYPSTIDWDLSGWTKTRIANRIAIKDDATGIMRYYEPGVANDIPNGMIAAGQAFWVQATGLNPVLGTRETVKTTGVAEFFRERPSFVPSMVISLSNGHLTDNTYLKIAEGAIAGSDPEDAPKLFNEKLNLSTINADLRALAINAVSNLECGEIQLRIDSLQNGKYSLSLDTRGFFQDRDFYFFDRYTGARVPARSGIMEFEVDSDSLSHAPDRFVLLIETGESIIDFAVSASYTCADAEVVIHGSERGVSFSLWNEGTQIAEDVEASGKSVSLPVSLESLNYGSSTIMVRARKGCSISEKRLEVVRSEAITLDMNLYADCNSGLPVVTASDIKNLTFKWYADLGESPVGTGPVFHPGNEGDFYVLAEDKITGCVVARDTISVVSVFSANPTLSYDEGVLRTDALGELSWYMNGELIEDQNSQALEVTLTGVYELRVGNNGCLSSVSMFVEHDNNRLPFGVYPNPTDGEVTIEGLSDADRIDVLSAAGQIVYSEEARGEKFDRKISLTSKPDGLYLLIVKRGDRNFTYRLLKTSK